MDRALHWRWRASVVGCSSVETNFRFHARRAPARRWQRSTRPWCCWMATWCRWTSGSWPTGPRAGRARSARCRCESPAMQVACSGALPRPGLADLGGAAVGYTSVAHPLMPPPPFLLQSGKVLVMPAFQLSPAGASAALDGAQARDTAVMEAALDIVTAGACCSCGVLGACVGVAGWSASLQVATSSTPMPSHCLPITIACRGRQVPAARPVHPGRGAATGGPRVCGQPGRRAARVVV